MTASQRPVAQCVEAGRLRGIAIAVEHPHAPAPVIRRAAAREHRDVPPTRERVVDHVAPQESRAAQEQERMCRSASQTARQLPRGTILTPFSFSCASISDATYLSPKPIRFALTRLWCTASPTIADTGSDSAKCV